MRFDYYYWLLRLAHPECYRQVMNGPMASAAERSMGERDAPQQVEHVQSGHSRRMISRYVFCGVRTRGRRVLEVACGLGWGARILSEWAGSVLAVDYCQEAIDFASRTWPSARFECARADGLSQLGGSFDCVTAMELIEHLEPEDAASFLGECFAVLSPGGVLFMSSFFPRDSGEALADAGSNPHHLHVYTEASIRGLLADAGFSGVRVMSNWIVVAQKAT